MEKVKLQVFEKLRSRFNNISLGDMDANATTDPKEATFFNIDYADENGSYGTVTIAVLPNVLKVYYVADIIKKLKSESLKKWYTFLRELRQIAMKNMLRFDVQNIKRPKLDLNDIKAEIELDPDVVLENRLYGSTKSSYQKIRGSRPARIIIRHNGKVNEEMRGARSRKIKSIFVENGEGERFKLPFKSLLGARAMARHISEGGNVYDTEGKAITILIEEYNSLTPFMRKLKKKYPDGHEIIESLVKYRRSIKSVLNKMKGKNTYKKALDELREMAECSDIDKLEDIGKRVKLTDSKLLPVIYKSVKRSRM